MVDIDILKNIGDQFSTLLTKLIQFLSGLGLNITDTGGKILGILLPLILAWVSFKFLEKPLKYIIIILMIALDL